MFYSVTVSTLLQEILSFINEKTKLTNNPDITVVNHNIFYIYYTQAWHWMCS